MIPPPPNRGAAHAGSGWRDAIGFVATIATLNLAYAIGNEQGVHGLAMLILAMLVASVVMVAALGGPGVGAAAVMLAPASFVIGLSQLALEVAYYLLLDRVTPGEGSLLTRIAIPLSLVVGWLVFSRRPPGLAVLGGVLVAAGVAITLVAARPSAPIAAAALAIASATAFLVRSYASELHPANRAAASVRERLRVTALVLLSSTLVAAVAVGAAMMAITAGAMPSTPLMPSPGDLTHPPTLVLAFVFGGLVLPALFYFSLAAVAKIQTENFTAVSSLAPAATLAVQIMAERLGVIAVRPAQAHVLAALAIVVAGTLLIVRAGRAAPAPAPDK